MQSIKEHWENIYLNKAPNEVSWTQEIPEISLDLIQGLNLPKTSRIIDIGGGDSKLVDYLLEDDYTDISVLDISDAALKRAQKRLGERAQNAQWIVSDIRDFKTEEKFDLWHDRAAFHFLTSEEEIENYLDKASKAIKTGGYLILGTFSTEGPKKCSGLEIRQYSGESLSKKFEGKFKKLSCLTMDHQTPFDTFQNFLFCSFQRLPT